MKTPRVAMREPTYFVLAALLDGPLHGYAIIKRAEQLSGGRIRIATGTLYTALDRLTDEGYVRLVSEELLGVALWLALNCALGISRSFSPSGQA